jgi:hypothetical protein
VSDSTRGSDALATKRALARLVAGPPVDRPDDAATLAAARRACTDLAAAERFVADGGVARLRGAVERTDDGHDALAAFERYRAACQFHSGHATDLPAGPEDVPD